jgi:hypothetical protein
MRRDAEVTVCALPPGASAERPTCAPDVKDWSAGWMVFVDDGQRGQWDEGDQILLVHQGFAQAFSIIRTEQELPLPLAKVRKPRASVYTKTPLPANSATRIMYSTERRLPFVAKPYRIASFNLRNRPLTRSQIVGISSTDAPQPGAQLLS